MAQIEKVATDPGLNQFRKYTPAFKPDQLPDNPEELSEKLPENTDQDELQDEVQQMAPKLEGLKLSKEKVKQTIKEHGNEKTELPKAGLKVNEENDKSYDQVVSHISDETKLLKEQVEDVLGHFQNEESQVSYQSASLNELTNYVKKVYGQKYEGKAQMPDLFKGQSVKIKLEVTSRLSHPVWKNVEIDELMEQHAGKEPEILKAITQIEIHLKRRGYMKENYQIQNPYLWINGYISGTPFESTPNVNSKGEIIWDNNQKTMPKELQAPGDLNPVNDKEIAGIFKMLQSQVPTGDADNGCFARADFSAYYMQVLRGFENVGKIRVDVKSGKMDLKPTEKHYVKGVEGTVWQMHTAATITTSEGKTYVMDVALKDPLEPAAWISALTSLSDDK